MFWRRRDRDDGRCGHRREEPTSVESTVDG